jgi:hypothetical protein
MVSLNRQLSLHAEVRVPIDHRVADTANSSPVSGLILLAKFLVISESELLVSEISRRLGLSLSLGISLSVHQAIQASLGRRSNEFVNFFLCISA